MALSGYYYLHENGDLIFKHLTDENQVADFRDSDLVQQFWPFNPSDRAGAWTILVEALALGAKLERIQELADLWGCDDQDGFVYAERLPVHIRRDGNQWMATRVDFVNLQDSHSGFGATVVEALSELAKDLELKPTKMWGNRFKDLVDPNG